MPRSGASGLEPRSAASPKPTLADISHVALIVALVAGLLFSVALAFDAGFDLGLLCLISTAALAAAALPLLLRSTSKLYNPIWFVVLIVGIGITGKAFYLVLGPHERVEFLLLGRRPEELLPAAFVVALGLLLFSLGYVAGNVRWRIPELTRLGASDWDYRRTVAVIGGLAILGLAFFVLFAARLEVSIESFSDLSSKRIGRPVSEGAGVSGYLRWGASLMEIAFYLALAAWLGAKPRPRRRVVLAVLGLAVLAAMLPLFANSRQSVMMLIIRSSLIWLIMRGLPRLRTVAVLAAASLVVLGSMLAMRRGRADLEGIREHVSAAELLEVTVGGRHFLDLSKTAVILDSVPEAIDYQYGKSLLVWTVAPVPRAWWPDKPLIGGAGQIPSWLFKTPVDGGVTPGLIGELIINFGVIGMLVGLLAAGLALRSLYETLRPYFPAKGIVLIYTMLLTRSALDFLPNDFSGSMTRLLKELIPLLVALHLCAAQPAAEPARSELEVDELT